MVIWDWRDGLQGRALEITSPTSAPFGALIDTFSAANAANNRASRLDLGVLA
jgi:hypothetical protein